MYVKFDAAKYTFFGVIKVIQGNNIKHIDSFLEKPILTDFKGIVLLEQFF